MPYRVFNTQEVARYLHLVPADVERLVKEHEIPFERRGPNIVFRKVEIDAWASQRILGLERSRLSSYHNRTSAAAATFLQDEALMPDLISSRFIDPVLPARTRPSALREMVTLANNTGRVADQKALLESIEAREELCSTGIPGGLALLHGRHPDPDLIESPFIVIGRTVQPIPFGAPDRQPTDLFFLLGCPDDQLHLHTLARLCMMASRTEMLAHMRAAGSADEIHDAMLEAEQTVLGLNPPKHPHF